jgi:two-component system, sensor histidine kinase RegB
MSATALPSQDAHAARDVTPEPLIGLGWIWRLRWGALIGQIAALGLAHFVLGILPVWSGLVPALLLLGFSNVALGRWLSRGRGSRRLIGLVLLFDVLLLTAMLYWSGGAANPFSAFYVVHVAVAALMLGPLWALLLVVLTSLCFGALFFVPAHELGAHASHAASTVHLQGMWAAYVLSAGFVAYFVSRVAAALREREQQVDSMRRHMAGMQRVAGLSTMAAGAAHELGTPLATIAVSASELATALGREERWAPYALEARTIREEVARCRDILDRLAMGAGQPAGEAPVLLGADDIVSLVRAELGTGPSTLEVQDALASLRVRCPPRALGHALKNLVKNGLDANRMGGTALPVTLRLRAVGRRAAFEIRDHGPGIAGEVLGRLGEPFFTTKPNGAGMGLGLFLVQSFVQQVGGELRFESAQGAGSLVTLTLAEGSLEESAA